MGSGRPFKVGDIVYLVNVDKTVPILDEDIRKVAEASRYRADGTEIVKLVERGDE